MLLIVLVVLFVLVMFLWFLSMVDAVAIKRDWMAFIAVLILGIVVFLVGSGIVQVPPTR